MGTLKDKITPDGYKLYFGIDVDPRVFKRLYRLTIAHLDAYYGSNFEHNYPLYDGDCQELIVDAVYEQLDYVLAYLESGNNQGTRATYVSIADFMYSTAKTINFSYGTVISDNAINILKPCITRRFAFGMGRCNEC